MDTNTTENVTQAATLDANAEAPKDNSQSVALSMAQIMSMLAKGRKSRRGGSKAPKGLRKERSRAKSARSAASRKKNRGK